MNDEENELIIRLIESFLDATYVGILSASDETIVFGFKCDRWIPELSEGLQAYLSEYGVFFLWAELDSADILRIAIEDNIEWVTVDVYNGKVSFWKLLRAKYDIDYLLDIVEIAMIAGKVGSFSIDVYYNAIVIEMWHVNFDEFVDSLRINGINGIDAVQADELYSVEILINNNLQLASVGPVMLLC